MNAEPTKEEPSGTETSPADTPAPDTSDPETEKEIDLNPLFPGEDEDLNTLFPDHEMKRLLKKISRNKKDLERMRSTILDSKSEETD